MQEMQVTRIRNIIILTTCVGEKDAFVTHILPRLKQEGWNFVCGLNDDLKNQQVKFLIHQRTYPNFLKWLVHLEAIDSAVSKALLRGGIIEAARHEILAQDVLLRAATGDEVESGGLPGTLCMSLAVKFRETYANAVKSLDGDHPYGRKSSIDVNIDGQDIRCIATWDNREKNPGGNENICFQRRADRVCAEIS